MVYTLLNFAMLAYRGGAHYNLYHHYADKAAMFDVVDTLGLATPEGTRGPGTLEFLGCVVHATRETAATSNVADVFNSIINMVGTATTIVVIVLSAGLSGRFGKKAVIGAGFSLAAVNAFAYSLLSPEDAWGMLLLAIVGSITYAPTIAVAWAMYADAADYSEWQTGRRFTGMVFATLGFALKSGLALGSAVYLWLMAGVWGYDTRYPSAPNAVHGYFVSSSLGVGLLLAGGALAIAFCRLNRTTTLTMAAELAERRRTAGIA
jgi:Na+/melibiose symporter-like transporter